MASDLTVADIVMLKNYKNQLGAYIYLNRNIYSEEKLKSLKEEKIRITNQLKNL